MDYSTFAFCIAFPGTTPTDLVKAALEHGVHIVNKELFDPFTDYEAFSSRIRLENGPPILPLFLFPEVSILADNEEKLHEAVTLSAKYS
ncbi:MAG: hypothetical protein EOP49_04075 [Sphingobacteriales bacterium]|nr:MAG: hypothetical protein EOP49_04075 [Sphingobacteriales bacterium]